MKEEPWTFHFHTNARSTPKEMLEGLGAIFMSFQNEKGVKAFHASKANQSIFVKITFYPEGHTPANEGDVTLVAN